MLNILPMLIIVNDDKNEAEFLGPIVVVMSISINPDNTETISKWFVPKTKKNKYQIYWTISTFS
jgi:predicted RNA binding protein with dsRBD fold (UPF0201 family)